jgi:biofilm protein TabA
MNDYGSMVMKIMIHTIKKRGAFLYLFETADEYGMCSADYHFSDLEDAEEDARDYGVETEDWIMIDDPLPDCQHDCIHPVRVKGRNTGNPIWGELEIYNGHEWVDFVAEKK